MKEPAFLQDYLAVGRATQKFERMDTEEVRKLAGEKRKLEASSPRSVSRPTNLPFFSGTRSSCLRLHSFGTSWRQICLSAPRLPHECGVPSAAGTPASAGSSCETLLRVLAKQSFSRHLGRMKTASVQRVPKQWSEILRWVAAGEVVEVTERDQVVAKIVPAKPTTTPDFPGRAKAVWGDAPPGKPLSSLVSEGRGGKS